MSSEASSSKKTPKKRPPPQDFSRVNELSRTARANWFGLLAYLAFSGVTLLGVSDIDFFLDSRQTDLPLIGVSIPTRFFFLFGPILGTALYVHLHLYLLKLWEALSDLPPQPGGEPVSVQISPWLVSDLALAMRRDGAAQARPLYRLSYIMTTLLVFAAGPFVIGYFWVRYWPAHELWVSLLTAGLFVLSLMTMISSFWTAHSRLKHNRIYQSIRWNRTTIVLTLVFAVPTAWLTILKTGAGGALLARAQLSEAVLTPVPADWLPYETARSRFHLEWCQREGLTPELCGPTPDSDAPASPRMGVLRDEWCKALTQTANQSAQKLKECQNYFTQLDTRFVTAWWAEHTRRIGALERWSPKNKDLREADLGGADARS